MAEIPGPSRGPERDLKDLLAEWAIGSGLDRYLFRVGRRFN